MAVDETESWLAKEKGRKYIQNELSYLDVGKGQLEGHELHP